MACVGLQRHRGKIVMWGSWLFFEAKRVRKQKSLGNTDIQLSGVESRRNVASTLHTSRGDRLFPPRI